jgi:hypothetical protein
MPMSAKKSLSEEKKASDSVPIQTSPISVPHPAPVFSSSPTTTTTAAPPINPPTPSFKIRLPRLSNLSSSTAHAKPAPTAAVHTTPIKVEESSPSLSEGLRRSGRRRMPRTSVDEGSASTRGRRSASHHPSVDGGVSSSGG